MDKYLTTGQRNSSLFIFQRVLEWSGTLYISMMSHEVNIPIYLGMMPLAIFQLTQIPYHFILLQFFHKNLQISVQKSCDTNREVKVNPT